MYTGVLKYNMILISLNYNKLFRVYKYYKEGMLNFDLIIRQ